MIGLAFDYPAVLWLAPAALAPLIRLPLRGAMAASIDVGPIDRLSHWILVALRACGVVAIAALLLVAAGPFHIGGASERLGEGAELVFLIDRSGSMNENFAGRTPSGGEESKASAAKRILQDFIQGKRHDFVGVAAFSTAPMLVMPLTDHRAAIKAA